MLAICKSYPEMSTEVINSQFANQLISSHRHAHVWDNFNTKHARFVSAFAMMDC